MRTLKNRIWLALALPLAGSVAGCSGTAGGGGRGAIAPDSQGPGADSAAPASEAPPPTQESGPNETPPASQPAPLSN